MKVSVTNRWYKIFRLCQHINVNVFIYMCIYIYIMPENFFKLVASQKVSGQSWIFQGLKVILWGRKCHFSSMVNLVCRNWVYVYHVISCKWTLSWIAYSLVWLAGWDLCRFGNLWNHLKNREKRKENTVKTGARENPQLLIWHYICLFVNLLYLLILGIYFSMWQIATIL